MTLSSALARWTRSTGSRVALVAVVDVVLVSALCHLAQILPSGPGHDAAHPHSSMSISAAENVDVPAASSESGGEHSCQHERSTAAHLQAPALTSVVKPAVPESAVIRAADTFSQLITDRPHLPGPRQHVLCVLRT